MLYSASHLPLAFIFGGVPEGLFIVYLVGCIWASARAINHTQGPATPLWLALIWIVPCAGSLLALIAIRKLPLPPPPSPPPGF